MTTTYQKAPGSRITGVDIQAAGERLDQLTKKHAHLTPELVVEDARSTDSPLHAAFEWNDGAAATAWRMEQAKYLIRSIVIIVEESPKSDPVRAFVSVETTGSEGPHYVTLRKAMGDDELRAQLLEDAKAEFLALRRKYAHLAELADVFAAIDRTAAVRGKAKLSKAGLGNAPHRKARAARPRKGAGGIRLRIAARRLATPGPVVRSKARVAVSSKG